MAKEITNKHWLRKWLKGEPHIIIGDGPRPYLKRWYIIPRNRLFNVYLHQFLRSDDDRALHDHPWWFASILLKGGYTEHREGGRQVRRRAGSIAIRKADVAHRVQLDYVTNCDAVGYIERVEIPAWTIILTGPKFREWGFLCPQGWKHWEAFDHDNGCGEA